MDKEKKQKDMIGQKPDGPGDISSMLTMKQVMANLSHSDLEAGLARRLVQVEDKLLSELGMTIRGGPFAGMTYTRSVTEGCFAPKLLGSYELELHPTLEIILQSDYDAIINIGCAEGYYAVGLARLLPEVSVYAHDLDENARSRCRDLAETNGVADRIMIEQEIGHSDFGFFEGRRVLIICDIEGNELELLDPVFAPAIQKFDLLVELHTNDADVVESFTGRFTASHDVKVIQPEARNPDDFPELASLSPLDQSLALIERFKLTPWVFLQFRHA